jgi:glycosyltransferase involved in cell wall biosynthesis
MKIVFLVNGRPADAMGIRARAFAERLPFEIHIVYRSANKVYAILRNLVNLVRFRPALCYVFDMGFSGVLAAGMFRMVSRCLVIVDTGDAIYQLSLSSGRGRLGSFLTKQLEGYALAISDRVVVRSHPHQELLASQGISADVIPDGVDLEQFYPRAEDGLRRQFGLDGFVVAGTLGSLIWNQRLDMCYGWELVEVIHRLRHLPIKGLVIGDGTGLSRLKERCAAFGILDRIVFTGRIPYDDLPRYLNLMDICLSTQTNDAVGQVRTTGKLPLYLASGRFILATDVGEAARVLPREMLVAYNGIKDPDYPERLADRLLALLKHPDQLQRGTASVALARTHFDYDILAARLRETVERLLMPQHFKTEAGALVPNLTAVTPPERGDKLPLRK